jgi:archaellum component FlaC
MSDSTGQLKRIAELVERAGGISKKQRGMRIEAEEWNTLVDILLGVLQIARLQEDSRQNQLEEKFAKREHEHLGQIGLAWLEPELQNRLGGGSSVSTRTLLSDFERKLQELVATTRQLNTQVDLHQQSLDRSAVAEIDRTKGLRDVQARLDGIANLRNLVGTLNTDVTDLRTHVSTVLELRNSLKDPTGQTINVADIRRDVLELKKLGDSFKGVDGRPLTMKDLELRLTDVASAAGVGGHSIDQRLSDFSAELENRIKLHNDETLKQRLDALNSEHVTLIGKLRTQIETSAAGVLTTAGVKAKEIVSSGVKQQNDQLDARLKDARVEITASVIDKTRGLISLEMATIPDLARAAAQVVAVDTSKALVRDLQVKLSTELSDQGKSRFDGRLKNLETGLPELQTRLVSVLDARVSEAENRTQATLSQQLNTQLSTTQQQFQATVTGQVNASIAEAFVNVDKRVAVALEAQTPAIKTQVTAAVTTATKNLNEQVSSEVGKQVGALKLEDSLKSAMKTQVRDLQVSIASQLSAQEARTSTLVNQSISAVRGDTKSMLDASLAQSRTDILSSVDKRFTNFRPTPLVTPGAVVIR